MILSYFTPYDVFAQFKGIATNWVVIISAVTVAMGFVYMTNAQIKMYQKNKTPLQLAYTLMTYVFFLAFLIAGLAFKGDVSSPEYLWWFNNVYANVGATIYAVMFFTLASSAYRTFVVSSIEAISLIVGGMVYTLRQVPLFQVYTPWIVPLGEWILLVPNTGGSRGAVIAAAIAALVVGIRTLWGKEVTLEVSS
jgi:general stress protein CsbA